MISEANDDPELILLNHNGAGSGEIELVDADISWFYK